jgi:hypothetical protein
MSGKNTCQEVFIGDGVSSDPITIPILPLNLLLNSSLAFSVLKKVWPSLFKRAVRSSLFERAVRSLHIWNCVSTLPVRLSQVRRVFDDESSWAGVKLASFHSPLTSLQREVGLQPLTLRLWLRHFISSFAVWTPPNTPWFLPCLSQGRVSPEQQGQFVVLKTQ